jgi:energy-coupling factor transport system permease protein
MHGPHASRFRPHDPRVALFVAGLWVAASLLTIGDPTSMLAAAAFVCAWHLATTRRLGVTARSLGRVVPFALIVVALNAVLVPGEPLLSVAGRRVVSRQGLDDGVFFALRLGVMLMAASAFLATAGPEATARGMYDLVRRVSRDAAARVALFAFLSMSFVPLVADEFQRIRVAQSFRGGDFSGGLLRRAQSVRAWLVPLLVSSIQRSGRLAMAVELREIRERLPRTIEPPHMHVADALLAVATVVAVVALSRAS